MLVTRLFDIAARANEKFPKDDFMCTKYNGEWEKTSTSRFISLSNTFARGLLKLGLKPFDRVAVITSATRTEWAVIDRGSQLVGITTVPIYPSSPEKDYQYIFDDAEVKYCFVSDLALLDKVKTIDDKCHTLEGIFSFDEIPGCANWKEILDLGKDDITQSEVDELSNGIKPDDLATIIYTSGTTGKPKGVLLTHQNILSNALASTSRIPLTGDPVTHNFKVLSFLPICHIFERMLFYMFQYAGFSVYFAESIDKMGENMKEVKPHYMSVVPRLLEKVYDKIYDTGSSAGGLKSKIFHWALENIEKKKTYTGPTGLKDRIADKLVFSKWRDAMGGNIITLVSGSAPLSNRLNLIFQNAGIRILEGYGLTETSPVISVNSFEHFKIGSVGTILDNLEVKIADDGEILVKGPSVTSGYLNNDEATKEAFTTDGFFRTGDIGVIDKDGFLFITDRKKEMFKTSGGKYIAPQTIENLAKASKFIEQIMVVGENEKMPTALIQPDFNFAKNWAARKNLTIGNTPEEIVKNKELISRIEKDLERVNTNLGKWEQIKKFTLTPDVWSIDNGLLTPTLKLKRKIIKEKYKDLYEEMYGR